MSLSEQLRLSEAALVVAPQFSRQAMRLRGQVLAARSFADGEVLSHQEGAPTERWESSGRLHR